MATKKIELEMANRGEGCLGKSADDEPVFILRAQDKFAPVLVQMWAELAGAAGAPTEKIQEAARSYLRMREWQMKNGCKVPD